MAKKHSSKTATQEAMQAANPRIQVFDKWAGVNFKDAPLGWEYSEPNKEYPHHQSDLPFNNFVIQNNMVTNMSDSVETRFDEKVIATCPDNMEFTGVTYLYKHWLFAAVKDEHEGFPTTYFIIYTDITKGVNEWIHVPTYAYSGGIKIEETFGEIHEIGSYEEKLIVFKSRPSEGDVDGSGKAIGYTCDIFYNEGNDNMFFVEADRNYLPGDPRRSMEHPELYMSRTVPDPAWMPSLVIRGMEWSSEPVAGYTQLSIACSYTNMWGSTRLSPPNTVYVEYSPQFWNSSRYVHISLFYPAGYGRTGADIWANTNENTSYVLATHVNISDPVQGEGGGSPAIRSRGVDWFGAMTDVRQYANAPLVVPEENSTAGPQCRHFDHIDSRMYYWGDPDAPYRLYIGGNIGNEMSIARSLGGGWVDIEPGSGIIVNGVVKWKTAQGANIVTIPCGNANTNQVDRFNLVEMTSTFTQEIEVKSWEYEEVSNVVGCNSRWGYGVFADGLYVINRYGLMVTTMAMEYNNQMRNQKVSEVIDPIFTERLANRLKDCRMVHIDGVIYIVLSEDESEDEPQRLDRVILCYDTDKKAWYTFTHGDPTDVILHAMPIDSEMFEEGLGIVTKDKITLYPSTGIQDTVAPKFDVLLETGELCTRIPMQAPYYVEQLEFRFDYFIGKCDVWIEGVDYYGREFKIVKKFGKERADDDEHPDAERRSWVEWIRVQKLVESFRITIKGPARFRMTHIIAKAYLQNNLIGMPYGFDASDTFRNRFGKTESIHHYVTDYNNLRRAIVT